VRDPKTIVVVAFHAEARRRWEENPQPSVMYVGQMANLYGLRVEEVINEVPPELRHARFNEWWDTEVLCRVAK
jgi:hypothetical protein